MTVKSKMPVERIEAFRSLLKDPTTSENDIQAFMESHTEFMMTPECLHHGLTHNSVISKFKLNKLSTDYAYLSKSTVEWRLGLVELEHPAKRIFKKHSKHQAFTGEFNDALAQVHQWRDEITKSPTALQDKLSPLQGDRYAVPDVWYVLIIGRDDELTGYPDRITRLSALLRSEKVSVLTYDSVLRHVETRHAHPKCVLTETNAGFSLKSAAASPENLFSYLKPGHLEVSAAQEADLKMRGYDIAAWRKGERLVGGGKQTQEAAIASLTTRLASNSEVAASESPAEGDLKASSFDA